MHRPLSLLILLVASLTPSAWASERDESGYVVLSPKWGWASTEKGESGTWGLSYSYYQNYPFGYGIAVNQMFGGPQLELTGKAILVTLGMSAGPVFSHKGLGLTIGGFSSAIYIGTDVRALWFGDDVLYSVAFFLPLWWRNGKFWDLGDPIGPIKFY